MKDDQSRKFKEAMDTLSLTLMAMGFFGALAQGNIPKVEEMLRQMAPVHLDRVRMIAEVLPGLLADLDAAP